MRSMVSPFVPPIREVTAPNPQGVPSNVVGERREEPSPQGVGAPSLPISDLLSEVKMGPWSSPNLLPVGAVRQNYWRTWKFYGASLWVVSVLREGYRIPFMVRPPLRQKPWFFKPPNLPEKRAPLERELEALRQKRAIEPAPPNTPGFYSLIFLVPKGGGGKMEANHRSVELKRLHRGSKFKDGTTEEIRASIQQGDWSTSLDLEDAYLHIPLHKTSRKFVRFAYQNRVWQIPDTGVWPLKCSMAVHPAHELSKDHGQEPGLLIHQYLDDWLLRSQDRQVLIRQTAWMQKQCAILRLKVNLEKSEIVPKQDFNFVGYRYHTVSHKVYPTKERIKKIKQRISTFLATDPNKARTWLSLMGLLSVTEKLVPLGRLHVREIQFCLASQWNQADNDLHARVYLSESARLALQWWSSQHNLGRGSPTHPLKPHHMVYSDASIEGWGGHTQGLGSVRVVDESTNTVPHLWK